MNYKTIYILRGSDWVLTPAVYLGLRQSRYLHDVRYHLGNGRIGFRLFRIVTTLKQLGDLPHAR